MSSRVLAHLTNLDLSPTLADRLGLSDGALRLRRAWPRAADHLLLEYSTQQGQIVPGQWRRNSQDINAAFSRLPPDTQTVLTLPLGSIGLQVRGADRRLRGLVPLLANQQARLLIHQPERRAVLKLDPTGQVYAKVVRPEQTRARAAVGQFATILSQGHFDTPQLLDCDEANGVLRWSGLNGVSLCALPGGSGLDRGAHVTGGALRALHAAELSGMPPRHGPHEEVQVLTQWLTRLEMFDRELSQCIAAHLPTVQAALLATPGELTIIHRDFYDKQVIIGDNDRVGLLDFDTLAYGEPALDLANALVHFELRALQGIISAEQARTASAALLAGYQPTPEQHRRIAAYAQASRLRLACVYAFRPRWRQCIGALLGV